MVTALMMWVLIGASLANFYTLLTLDLTFAMLWHTWVSSFPSPWNLIIELLFMCWNISKGPCVGACSFLWILTSSWRLVMTLTRLLVQIPDISLLVIVFFLATHWFHGSLRSNQSYLDPPLKQNIEHLLRQLVKSSGLPTCFATSIPVLLPLQFYIIIANQLSTWQPIQ